MRTVSIKISATNKSCQDCGIPMEFNSVRDYIEWDRAGFDEIYRDYIEGEDPFDHEGRKMADWQLDRIAEKVERNFQDGIDVNGNDAVNDDPDDPSSFMYFYCFVCECIEYEAGLVNEIVVKELMEA